MGSGESKPVNKSVLGSPAPVLGSPVASYGAPGGGRRRSNRRGRGKTMRGGQCKKKMYGGMHKGKRHSKGSRRNKSKSRSNRSRHH